VRLLQRLLNLRTQPTPRLAEDGIFGPKTARALATFQDRHRISSGGTVDNGTWRALGVTIDIDHPVTLLPQPTNMTCWSAAASMLFGDRSVGSGGAATTSSGGLQSSHSNVEAFADSFGLTMHPPRSWTVRGLADVLSRSGPLWIGGQLPVSGTTSGHAIVIGSLWSDGAVDGSGTAVVIYDPWPPGRGSTRVVFYGDMMRQFPSATTYMLHR
jgi:hypothetical protein